MTIVFNDGIRLEKVDKIIKKYKAKRSALVPMLHDVQAEFNWLPKDALAHIAKKLNVPLSDIFGIGSFYKAFSLEPRGKHLVRVCLGTACHVRGGQRILDTLERVLGIKSGETTTDRKFTLERVNCLGCCALGPVMVVGDEYHGGVQSAKVEKILSTYD